MNRLYNVLANFDYFYKNLNVATYYGYLVFKAAL